ncbi:hypothetical protein AVEN_193250-1 [Araneus ventricosus]|uniref:Uncharacterized protein n=1 Tax=Araneus ventricosus TaxID=182803 RepID=A0A4Y2HMM8_ARAVE|nr:hypothetical protein AVEN_193250-1 [Araneus ventricosus]
MDGQTQTLGLNRKILQYPNKTSGKSREPTGDSTKHTEDDFTSRLQNVWSSTGQQRGFTHFQLDKKGSATPPEESSYLISKDLFHHSAPQVIEGLIPLHLNAEQEVVCVRATRLGKASHLKDQNIDPKHFEGKISMAKFHPASFHLENRVSFDC